MLETGRGGPGGRVPGGSGPNYLLPMGTSSFCLIRGELLVRDGNFMNGLPIGGALPSMTSWTGLIT